MKGLWFTAWRPVSRRYRFVAASGFWLPGGGDGKSSKTQVERERERDRSSFPRCSTTSIAVVCTVITAPGNTRATPYPHPHVSLLLLRGVRRDYKEPRINSRALSLLASHLGKLRGARIRFINFQVWFSKLKITYVFWVT